MNEEIKGLLNQTNIVYSDLMRAISEVIQNLFDRNTELTNDKQKLTSEIATLNMSYDRIQKENEDYKNKNNELLSNNQILLDNVSRYKTHLENNNNTISELEQYIDTELRYREEEIVHMRKHINTLEDKLILANRLSNTERYKGMENSLEVRQKKVYNDRLYIAGLIDKHQLEYYRTNNTVALKVNILFISSRLKVSETTIRNFTRELKNRWDSRYDGYPYFKLWVNKGAKYTRQVANKLV